MALSPTFPSASEVEAFCAENAGKEPLQLRLKKSKPPQFETLLNQLEVRSQMSERFGPLIECPGYVFPPKSKLSQASSCATNAPLPKIFAPKSPQLQPQPALKPSRTSITV